MVYEIAKLIEADLMVSRCDCVSYCFKSKGGGFLVKSLATIETKYDSALKAAEAFCFALDPTETIWGTF